MLSIIVPVRNESENLVGVFDYFSKNLNNFNYEVLLINDFSKDDTFKKAEEISKKFSRFKVLENGQKGLGGAINLGIKEAKGEKYSYHDGRSIR